MERGWLWMNCMKTRFLTTPFDMANIFDTVINERALIGMNDRYPSHELPSGLFSLLDNCLIADNKIVKRFGTTGSNAVGSKPLLGGSAFEPNGGTKHQVVCLDGVSNAQLYQSTDGMTFSAIGSANLTAGAKMNFVQASNILFGFNGTDEVDYDGTTVTKNRSTVPLGKFAFYYHNYLFVAGVSGNPNRLYWSDLGTPTNFTNTNFVDINANDGDMITGLNAFNGELMVFKNNSVWSITGFSGSTFSTTTIAGQNTNNYIQGYGTPSHRSIIAVGAHLYYLSFLGGVPHIRRFQRSLYGIILDEGIYSYELSTTLSNLNLAQLSKVSAIYDGKYLYWALPNGSATENTIVICLWPERTFQTPLGPMNCWTKFTSGMNVDDFFISTISGRDKVYFTDNTTTSKVFVFDSSVATDNGVAITMEVRPRDFMADGAKKAKWKYFYFKFDTSSAGSLKVNARVDQAASFMTEETVSLAGNSPGLGPTGTFTLGVSVLGGAGTSTHRTTLDQLTGHLLGLQLLESTSHPATIYDMQVYANKKGLRNS